jgi:hypothetical protein
VLASRPGSVAVKSNHFSTRTSLRNFCCTLICI